jgi:class 3 adenylate cyclase
VPETRDNAVAFADIASSTRIYRELGDAAASAIANAFCTRVAELVPRFAGRMVKTLGDEVMSVFPGAEEAVAAMSALHRDIAAAPPGGHVLQLHTGIDYGPVIVESDDLYGTIVNTAAYLAATGRAEQILTTQAVVDRLSPVATPAVRPIYTTRLKGHEHDSLIYEVIWQVDPGELTNRNPARLQYVPPDEGALLLSTDRVTLSLNRQRPRVQLGRDAGNDLVLIDPFVSRRHAIIELEAVRFRLVDASANGTFVAFDGFGEEIHLLRGETLLHGSGRISLGRSFGDPLATPISFRRDKRSLYRV